MYLAKMWHLMKAHRKRTKITKIIPTWPSPQLAPPAPAPAAAPEQVDPTPATAPVQVSPIPAPVPVAPTSKQLSLFLGELKRWLDSIDLEPKLHESIWDGLKRNSEQLVLGRDKFEK